MAVINFNTATKHPDAQPHRVYTRAAWADSWTERPDIACVQCVWNAAPDRSSATLVRDYGRTLTPGGIATSDLTALSLEGAFVLIEWDNDESGINYWLGVIDGRADAPDGPTDGTIPASGRQSFTAYGMERLLQVAPVLDTVWDDSGVSTRSGGATAFNAGGKPNRSASVITDETYVFDFDPTAAEFWSTQDIINHLLFYHLPTNDRGVASIPWTLANASIVPDWDAPEVETEGLTIWEILNRLLDSRLLLGWAVGFDNTSLNVAPFSLAAASIALGGETFAANGTQHTLTYSSDPMSEGEISIDRSDMCDQVIVRGAQRVSVCTVRVAEGDLEAGWTTALEDDYNDGASNDVSYASWDLYRQREANDTVRRGPPLEDVFSLLLWPDAWGWTVDNDGSAENVFDPDSGTDPYVPYRGAVELLPSLPFKQGGDYAGAISSVYEHAQGDFRKPLVMVSIEGFAGEIVDVTRIGQGLKIVPETGETIDYTVSVETDPDRLGLRLRVHGGPQHAIAGSDFTALTADEFGTANWDILTTIATVALTDDRYCEAIQPATPSTADVVRRRVFHVGDAYQQIYIVPGTVVEVGIDNDERTSDGGYLRDDTDKLGYLAELLEAYHTNPRNSLTLRTHRRTGQMNVGDMIDTANGTSIEAVVTRIQIDAPLGDGRQAPQATQTFIATAVPLDFLATLAIASRR